MKKYLGIFISFVVLASSVYAVTLKPSTSENSLIVYNSNVGLVHETRKLKIEANEKQIIYEDVASSIDTGSVNVSLPYGVSLYSQQYRYDKLTQNKLINAHIGKDVQVKVKKDAENFKIIQAILLSSNGASSIVKSENKVIIVSSKNIIFKTIPKELITKPSLVWNIASKKKIDAQMSIDYLINNITYKSNYILNIHEDEADLTGWISIDNRSGKNFENTRLHILAGDLNRAKRPSPYYKIARTHTMRVDSMQEVSEQAHEGYHFYTVPFKVTLRNNEKTQIQFISQGNIPIQRKYTAQMRNPNNLQGEISGGISQYITIKGLDFALPSGVIRSYSKLQNTNILLGESRVKHTAKNTEISLRLGKNFDLKVKETLLKHTKTKQNLDISVAYSLTNSSNEAKIIQVRIPFNKRNGSKVKSEMSYTFTKGNIVTFNVKVRANSTKRFKVYYTTKVTK